METAGPFSKRNQENSLLRDSKPKWGRVVPSLTLRISIRCTAVLAPSKTNILSKEKHPSEPATTITSHHNTHRLSPTNKKSNCYHQANIKRPTEKIKIPSVVKSTPKTIHSTLFSVIFLSPFNSGNRHLTLFHLKIKKMKVIFWLSKKGSSFLEFSSKMQENSGYSINSNNNPKPLKTL